MSQTAYRLIHLVGILMVYLAFGAAIARPAAEQVKRDAARVSVAVLHGVGLVVIIIAGFGMLAKMGVHWPFPGWIIAKLTIWLLLGVSLALSRRKLLSVTSLFGWVLALGGASAYLAIFKPF